MARACHVMATIAAPLADAVADRANCVLAAHFAWDDWGGGGWELEVKLSVTGCGSKLNRRGKPRVLVHFTSQGNLFGYQSLSNSRVSDLASGLQKMMFVVQSLTSSAYGCGSKTAIPKWNSGKWKHGPKPAVCPSCLILSHSHIKRKCRDVGPRISGVQRGTSCTLDS